MIAYVVVEGTTDVAVLRAVVLAELLHSVGLVSTNGRANLASIARSLLVTRRKPVAVLIDTDAVADSIVQERRETTEELLRDVAAGIPTKVILLVPHLEVIFFQAPGLIDKVFGNRIPDQVRLLGRMDPKAALAELQSAPGAPRDVNRLLDRLDEADVLALRSTGPIKELVEFLTQVSQAAAEPTRK